MTEKLIIWWIDDKEEDKEDADSLENEIGSALKVIFSQPNSALEKLEIFENPPDLFLVDWNLREFSDFPGEGMTMEGRIREEFSNTPIYAFSLAADSRTFQKKEIAQERFEKLVSYDDLQNKRKREDIYEDACWYKKVRKAQQENDKIVNLLKVPEESKDELQRALPEGMKKTVPNDIDNNIGGSLKFTRWVRRKLFRKPGILGDKLRVATQLGMEEEVFEDYFDFVESARYRGIFHNTEKKYWWMRKLNSIIFKQAKEKDIKGSKPWKLVPEIVELGESDYAKCAECGEKYPQTVARDLHNNKEYPVHYRCSNIEETENDVFSSIRYIS